MKELIDEIIEIEWELFTNLNNTDGRASCQDDKLQFVINRQSQWELLNKDILSSYLNDLYIAQENNQNLLFQKYAYMMEITHPQEYENIKKYLPKFDIEKEKIIDKIVDKVYKWEIEFTKKYPEFSKFIRPIENKDGDDYASAMTYLRAEHRTYSYTTNLLYLEFINKIEYNLTEKNFENIVKKQGFNSIEEYTEILIKEALREGK